MSIPFLKKIIKIFNVSLIDKINDFCLLNMLKMPIKQGAIRRKRAALLLPLALPPEP